MNDSEVYCNVFYSAQGAGDSEGQPPKLPFIFETKLNAPLRQPPSVLKNHHTLANNLLAQDINNVIYLIDHQGGILWQRSIGEAMMGAAQQIDLLKNNKLQIVFNTRSKIYVIDRLGNDVPPYPAALPAPATAPMAVFDYDRTRSYRFFVPCIGGKIYACEAGGKPLKGFDPPALGMVTQPLMHVRRAGRDFIIVTDNRRVHILDRRGEVRLPTTDIFPAPQTLAWCEYNANGSAARLAITTAKGELLSLSLDNGVAEKIPIDQKLSEHHHFAVSRQGDYIFLNGRELSVFAPNLKSKLDVSVKQPPAAPPLCFSFGGEQFYSVYSAHENKAYLWDGEGRLLPSFPLPAAAPAILVQLSKTTPYQIVVGDPNGYLSCYGIHRQED